MMVKLIIQNSKFKTQNQLYCQNLPTSQVHQSPITNHQSPITIRKVLDEGASQW